MEMGGCRAKLRIGQRHLPAPACVGKFEQRTRSRNPGKIIGINNYSPAAIAKSRPAICLPKNILRRQLASAHFFVAPEHVTLRMATLDEQAIGQSNSFYCFAVKNRPDLDPRLVLEVFEN